MKCNNITTETKESFFGEWKSISSTCPGEMILIGFIQDTQPDYEVPQKELYQCEVCKTIKLI